MSGHTGTYAKILMDLRHFAVRENKAVTAPFVLRMFFLTQGFQFVFCRRIQDALAMIPVAGRPLRRIWWWLTCLFFGSELAIGCTVDGGLYIPHPYGIVVGVCRIGRNVTILQNVTIGARSQAEPGGANVGNDVFLSAGAVLLGNISIGEGASVGANSVVMKDIPAGAVAVGAPARILA